MWKRLLRRLGIALNLRDPPNVPTYGWSYFDHLAALYVTLNRSDDRANEVIKKAANAPDHLTWGDIFLLESVIFSLQPDDVIERTAWIYRERFREITSPTIFEKYKESEFPKDAKDASKTSLLKADLTRILDLLHWYYALIPMRESVRKSLTIWCLRMVLFYSGLLGAILVWCYISNSQFLAMIACVIYCGTVGGFVSSQRRMQSIPSEADPLITVFGLDNAGYYLWLSPLLGSIFAVVLTFMFIAGVLKGVVFPDFYSSPGGVHGLSFFAFAWNTLPKNSEDYAKLFVWAFLAGFAERLVPDSLDRLASKLEQADKLGPPGSSSAPPQTSVSDTPKPPKPESSSEDRPALDTETLKTIMRTGEMPPSTTKE